jgi:RNA polymerase sigma factor (sigma-70 family)
MDEAIRDFERLMERVRSGCPEAARELFDLYGPAVRVVVRRKLLRPMRRQYDSTDFTQSVWASFFRTPADQYEFPTPEALVAFLSRVASNKVMETTRQKLGTQRCNLRREQSLDAPHPEQGGAVGEAVPARVATPSQYAIADERWENLTQGLPPPHRRVLELLRDGYQAKDIAHRLGIHEKVIQRLRDRLRRHLEAS